MSKVTKATRTTGVREAYVEQLPYGQGLTGYMNQKRKPFRHLNSADDIDLPFRSTSNYLRELHEQQTLSPNDMMTDMYVPRTKTASELASKSQTNRPTTGNPRYKAPEDYYEEIQLLKKDMKAMKNENGVLRAKIRRLEEDNVRKRKEIENIYDTNKDDDLRGSLTDRTNNNNNVADGNVILRLKQRIFKLESQLKEKETKIDEIQSDPKWTKSKELEIQNRALVGEVERQKVERSNCIKSNAYPALIEDGKLDAIRKLTTKLDDSTQENESLKKKVQELKNKKSLPTSSSDDKDHSELQQVIDDLKQKCDHLQNEIRNANDSVEVLRVDRDGIKKELGRVTKELENKQRELSNTQEELNNLKQGKQSGRSSPSIKAEDVGQIKETIRDSKPNANSEHLLTAGNLTPRILSSNSNERVSPLRTSKQISPRSTTPTRKLTDSTSSRKSSLSESITSSKSSPRKLPNKNPTTLNDPRVKDFREKHAATVIQREWRNHDRPRKEGIYESALKSVQAAIRGFFNRTKLSEPVINSTFPTPKPRSTHSNTKSDLTDNDDNEDNSIASQLKYTKKTLPTDNVKSYDKSKELDNKSRRTPSPQLNSSQSTSPISVPTKKNLLSDRGKPNLNSRTSIKDDERLSKSKSSSPTSSPTKKDHQPTIQKVPTNIRNNEHAKSNDDDDDDDDDVVVT